MKLTADAASVAVAREHAGSFLAETGEPRSIGLGDALVAVSELVTNAVVHASGPIELELTDDGVTLKIAVSDGSDARPRLRAPDLTGGTGGLGLRVLAAMGARMEVLPMNGGGKCVTARLASPCRGRGGV